jgi:hypothetical protein
MRLGEIKKVAARQSGPTPRGGEPAPTEPAIACCALVALTPAPAAHDAPEAYRQAPFLAHLLAMKDQHPQTRERRRAEPNEAIAVYRAAVALTRFG